MARLLKMWTVLGLFLLAGPAWVGAQVNMALSFDESAYIAYETVTARVAVENLSGADLTLAESGGWMTFIIKDQNGTSLAPMQAFVPPPRIIKAAKGIEVKVKLDELFGLNLVGTYHVTAILRHHDQKYASNPKIITITDGRVIWQQAVGVTSGKSMGEQRRFQVLMYRDTDRVSLFFRMREVKTDNVLTTYRLGSYMPFIDPQITLDKSNRLHVMFMTAPRLYTRATIGTDGMTVKQDWFKDDQTRPKLVVAPSGEVEVRGGTPWDPDAPDTASGSINSTGPRRLSDRPPGL